MPRVRFQPGFGGANGRIIIEGANEDLARAMNVIDAYGSFLFFNDRTEAGEAGDNASVKPPPVLHADDTTEPATDIADTQTNAPYSATWEPEAVDGANHEPVRSPRNGASTGSATSSKKSRWSALTNSTPTVPQSASLCPTNRSSGH